MSDLQKIKDYCDKNEVYCRDCPLRKMHKCLLELPPNNWNLEKITETLNREENNETTEIMSGASTKREE